jgi:hypothetical protein
MTLSRYCLIVLLALTPTSILMAGGQPSDLTNFPPVAAQITAPPTGNYSVAQLVLEKARPHLAAPGQYGIHAVGIRGEDVVITSSYRDGKMQIPGRLSLREIVGTIEIGPTSFKGVYIYEANRGFGETRFALEATITAGRIAGTWTTIPAAPAEGAPAGKTASGTLSGTVKTEAQLAKENAFATQADWPCWSGPATSLAATPTGLKLAQDFAGQLPVWRSEELVPHGNGNAPNGPARSFNCDRSPGGGASLVVTGGKVVCSYYQPAGTVFDNQKGRLGVWSKVPPTGNPAEDVKHFMINHYKIQPDHPRWKWMVEKMLLKADEVYLCLDAATGKTLWKTVFPEATQYQPGHKQGPVNNTPCIGDGRVYVVSTIGTLRALDLATGKEVWSTPGALPNVCGGDKTGNNAPIFVGKTVVTGNHQSDLLGFDAATGKKLWSLPGKSFWAQVPAIWRSGGREYVVSLSAAGATDEKKRPTYTVLCVEPQTGTVLWEAPVAAAVTEGVSVHGDVLYLIANGTGLIDKENPDGITQAWKLSKEGMTPLWQTATPWADDDCPPAVDGKAVLVSGPQRSALLDAATGKELATYVGKGPHNEGHTTLVEDLVLLHIDGSHGNNDFVALSRDPASFAKPLGWGLAHPGTTTYHEKPMTHPVVEGRLFMRGHDGVYCYDLRTKP